MGDQPNRASIEAIGARVLRSWWFLGVVSAAIIGLLVLASWPCWFNRFVLKATTRIVEVSASAPGIHVFGLKLPSGEIQIFGANAAGLPPELAAIAAAAGSVRLVASSATLQSISLQSGAGLVVRTTSDGSADIGVLNDGSISLALSGSIDRIDDSGQRTTLVNLVRATSWDIRPAERNNPARLMLPAGVMPISLYNQPIGNFWFRPRQPTDGDPLTFHSEIIKGELQMLDTGTKIELEPGELVLLEGGSRTLSRLEFVDKAIAVDISGTADRISAGPLRPGAPLRLDRDLTPSVLSYLVGQHELKLTWGIALAVLGALWKARQWALKWGK
jgi:hypothetical protein